MGSWGHGTQSNDTALDAIEVFEDKPRTKESIHAFLLEVKRDWITTWPEATLGVVDRLLDEQVPLSEFSDSMALILEALEHEKQEDQLGCWSKPDERLEVLKVFESRLAGKDFDMEFLNKHNTGLFKKIGEHFGYNS
jgi:hypothetical protein